VYRYSDLVAILRSNRAFWRLANSTTAKMFIAFLMNSGRLREIVFPFPRPYARETRYAWGDVQFSEIVLSLKPKCHFSHYSAVKLHGLTEQIPKTTYINFEQPLASNATGNLSQTSIDIAFKRKVRTTSYIAETEEFRVCILNGKNTGYLGVVEHASGTGTIRVTNLERTLIDITVRPVYAGGVHEVLKAYRLAKPELSVNRLAAMLQQLEYIYPYHQAIGFYLDRAGYKPAQLDLLRRFEVSFKFYLVHQMKETDYIKEWRLYVPKGF
jgi:predicted transcriptional regulator of viral defense system